MQMFFQIFGKSVSGYGLMIVLGVVLANGIAYFKAKKEALSFDHFIILECYTFLGAALGAKGLYLYVSRNEIQWERIFEFDYFNSLMQGGFVFFGGLIGGLLCLLAAGKIHNLSADDYLQKFVFLIPFVHGFGRIGCFLAGCCYGIPYDGPLAVTFPQGSLAPHGFSMFPIQIFEAVLLLLLSVVVWWNSKYTAKKFPVCLYLGGYSIIRFFTEMLRFDAARGGWGDLSTSQWISLLLLAGICVYALIKKKNRYSQN